MLKKVFIYGFTVFVLALAGAYFWFAARLSAANRPKEVCRAIEVKLLDSLQNRFVTPGEIIGIMDGFMGKSIGKPIQEIDLNVAEKLLDQRSAIKKSQVSINREGVMHVDITQRKPIMRFQTESGGFYVDPEQYIFPLIPSFTSYVPIVSGHIPFAINAGHRGKVLENYSDWMDGIMELGHYISTDPFWEAQIEQIYVAENGDILLAPRVGDHEIIFGDLKDIKEKFNKLYTFYRSIIPETGWDRYSCVNLKYKDQIICKLKNKKKR